MTRASTGVTNPVSPRILNEAFYRAVVAADRAPSAHDRRPWRWRVSNGVLELSADRSWTSGPSDPGSRFALISCGAALHHARLNLAAHGWHVTVTRFPAGEPDVSARLHIDGAALVSPATADLARCIKVRHTGPGPIIGSPIEPEVMRTIAAAFESQQVRLKALRPDQILDLTVATAHIRESGPAQAQWHAELALWAGGDRIVAAADDARRPLHHSDHDRAATFAVLHGTGDQDIDWLHAGEALSTGSLVATGLGVSVLPLSAPVEHADARQLLRRVMPGLDTPYQAVRLGRCQTAHREQARPPAVSSCGPTTGTAGGERHG
jgi:hypothetical protein